MQADHTFDGGALDCGSGLILLIRQHMQQTPEGGVLELRTAEPTVEVELPPWCRMTGHHYLGSETLSPGRWRHFLRRGSAGPDEAAALAADHQQAQAYTWRLRGRHTGSRESTLYCRTFSWKAGQAASVDEKDAHPSAVELLLSALAADVLDGFAAACSQQAIIIDELEATLSASLQSLLAHFGLEPGDPGLGKVDLSVFVTSPASGESLRRVFDLALSRAPVYRTLTKACQIQPRLAIM